MPELPYSVRLALWGTAALAGASHGPGSRTLEEAVERAAPDLDDVTEVIAPLRLWRDLGERVLLVALPAPGRTAGLPRGSAKLTAAATEVGECVYVPAIGAALVPRIEQFGHGVAAGDGGTVVRAEVYDCEPVPAHRLEMLSVRDAERSLRATVLSSIEVLDDIGAVWGSQSARTRADSALRSGRWALPDGIPAPALDLLTLAGTVATIAELAATEPDPSLVATTGERRAAALARLAAEADQALEVATNVAALQLRA